MRPGELVASRFRITELAGRGGMGTVWRAVDQVDGVTVALKLLHDDDLQYGGRLAREARVLAQLQHPAIVRYVAHGELPSGGVYLAMEWLDGETLSARLRRGPLSVREALVVVRRVADALAATHRAGVVHRDVKPGNVFLPGGAVADAKLLDFGLARGGATRTMMTAPGVMLGTPAYIAPEQARGINEVDARADVFALGGVLFRCITGRAPFLGDDVIAVLTKVILEPAPALRSVAPHAPGDVERLVARMLAKEPGDRPADASAVLREIDRLAEASVTLDAAGLVEVSAESLTTAERGMVSLVLARTVVGEEAGSDRLDAAVAPFGGRLETLIDGTRVVSWAGRGHAHDQAAQAARCALAIRAQLPRAPIVVATGRGELGGSLPMGDAIDRASAMLRSIGVTPLPEVVLDSMTAALLDARFELRADPRGAVLVGERELAAPARTLLGRPTPCVGRDRELGVLTATLQECIDEPVARAVVVTAPAGAGKSRLRDEMLREVRARAPDVEVWVGYGDPTSAGSPFALVGRAIRRAAGVLDDESPEARYRKLAARVAKHVDAAHLGRVTRFLGELVGVPHPDASDVQLRAARAETRLMADQMRRAWEDFLDAETAAHPVLIVLEDLHWGDRPSVDLIDHGLRRLRERPLMVLALARPEVEDVFPNLWAQRDRQELRLPALTRRACERLCRAVLRDIDDATLARVVERADGNALYLEEVIRAVAEGKADALPDTVVAMVQSRLETLESDARRLLRAASVFGRTFWRGGLESLLGEEGAGDLDAWLALLEQREIVSRRPETRFAGQVEYAFRHALMREGAYAMLTDADKTLGHRLAGAWLEGLGERDALPLAEHFERGGVPGRAIEHYTHAAQQALDGNDFSGVLARAARGIACGAEGEALGRLHVLQAEAHRWRGEWSECGEKAREALQNLLRGSPRWWRAAAMLALVHGVLGQKPEMLAIRDELLAIEPVPEARSAASIALVNVAAHLTVSFAEVDRARPMAAKIDALVEMLDDPRDIAVLSREQLRAIDVQRSGDLGAYVHVLEGMERLAEERGDLRAACLAREKTGDALKELGQYERAARMERAVIEDAERLGLPSFALAAKSNLGYALTALGDVTEALSQLTEAADGLEREGDPRLAGAARTYLALALAASGDAERACVEARAAAEMTAGVATVRPLALGVLARAELLAGRPKDALATASEAMRSLQSAGHVEEGESRVRLVYAEALAETGQLDLAKKQIAIAYQDLLARAGHICDAALRASFLERVPENAAIRAHAARWHAAT